MMWGWSHNARIEFLKLSVQCASMYSQRHTGGRGKLVLATWSIEKADWEDKEQYHPPRPCPQSVPLENVKDSLQDAGTLISPMPVFSLVLVRSRRIALSPLGKPG